MTHFPLNKVGIRYDVMGVGNAIVDIIARVDDEFITQQGMTKGTMALIDAERAESLYAALGQCTECSGGSVANTVSALASLGVRASYLGRVRDDELGHIFRHDMRATGINYDVPPAPGGLPTARCFVCVTPDAERTMNTYLGACTEFAPEDLDLDKVKDSSVLYLEGYLWYQPVAREAIAQSIAAAREEKRHVAITLSDPFCVENNRDAFRALIEAREVDLLFANEHEAKALVQTDDLDTAAAWISERVPLTLITRGAEGADVWLAGNQEHIDAEPVHTVVDLTGAGDLFAAGVLYGLVQGWSVRESVHMGHRCAREIIQQIGARALQPLTRLVA